MTDKPTPTDAELKALLLDKLLALVSEPRALQAIERIEEN